jgi:hypothetical protein
MSSGPVICERIHRDNRKQPLTVRDPRPGSPISRTVRQSLATRCPITGKRSYRTKRKARRLLQRIRTVVQRNGERGIPVLDYIEQYPYKCPHCPAWHLTSHPRTFTVNDVHQTAPAAAKAA